MPNTKTGSSLLIPDIRPENVETITEAETGTEYKAVDVHPVLGGILNKLAFLRTHASAVWWNRAAKKTVTDEISNVTDMLSLRFGTDKAYEVGDYVLYFNGAFDGLYRFKEAKTVGAWDGLKVEQVSLSGILKEHESKLATLSNQYSDLVFNNSPIYSYFGPEGKTVENLDCGDAKLLLVFCDYTASETLIGQAFIVVRGYTWQFASQVVTDRKSCYFDFTEDGILNQKSQRVVDKSGDWGTKTDTNTAMVVRAIFKLA